MDSYRENNLVQITVCSSCKVNKNSDAELPDGLKLAEMLRHCLGENKAISVRLFKCLARCDHGCNLVIQSQAKIAYVISEIVPDDQNCSQIVDFAKLYGNAMDGFVPWKERPEIIKKSTVTRLPCMNYSGSLMLDAQI